MAGVGNPGFDLLPQHRLHAAVQYLRTYSTISNYDLQDFIVAAGPTFRF